MSLDIDKIYKEWKKNATEDEDIVRDLEFIEGNHKEIEDRFYKDLTFGTAGIRGILGAGTNRMNIYVILKITRALSQYILTKEKKNPSAAISYDSRNKSKFFAEAVATVFAANGIKTYIYKELMPVPLLSFAVRNLKCTAGVMITASHNPSEYNGYKIYGSDGCQIGKDEVFSILSILNNLNIWDDFEREDFFKALKDGKINYIKQDVIEKYFEAVSSCLINHNLLKDTDLKVVYTPLNGAGMEPVSLLFEKLEFKNLLVVKEQQFPDGNFPTCKTPNPETKEALSLGLKYCKKYKPDLLIATDPDADRVGVLVPTDEIHSEYKILNGNEIGILMFSYICEQRLKFGNMPQNPIAIKTIVSTKMAEKIAKRYSVELINVLTGFRYIGKQIKNLENKNEQDRFIFGFEESQGYLSGSYVRDKDGVFAAVFLCEIASYYKNKKSSISKELEKLYETYGYFKSSVKSFYFKGQEGMETMRNIMQSLREKNIDKIGSLQVIRRIDYLFGISFDLSTKKKEKIYFDESDVLQYELQNNSEVIVRPSGTEPKMKLYFNSYGKTEKEAKETEKMLFDNFKIDIFT